MNPEVPYYMQKIQVSNAEIKCTQEDWDRIFNHAKKEKKKKANNVQNNKGNQFKPNGF